MAPWDGEDMGVWGRTCKKEQGNFGVDGRVLSPDCADGFVNVRAGQNLSYFILKRVVY